MSCSAAKSSISLTVLVSYSALHGLFGLIIVMARVFLEILFLRSSMLGCQPFSSTVSYVTGFAPKNLA